MADFKVAALEKMAAEVVRPTAEGEVLGAPRFFGNFECYGQNGLKWRESMENAVMTGGRAHILNRLFASGTASTAGMVLVPHSASGTANTTQAWSNVSASRVTGIGANYPALTWATSASYQQTISCSYAFTSDATQQTISGGAILFYTSASMATSQATGANATEALMYSLGHFAVTRTVTGNDTLNVTLTVAFA